MVRFSKRWVVLITGLMLALGIASAGAFIAYSIHLIKQEERYVSVKGLAEQEVKSDVAIWYIDYRLTGDDIKELSEQSSTQQKKIMDFLTQNGFSSDAISIQQTSVIDRQAKEYFNEKPPQRYIIKGGITVRTTDITRVQTAAQKTGELIQAGVVLIDEHAANPIYLFTQLDKIRPQLLERSTKSAYLAAQQFAIHSKSRLGSIRRAKQGVFQIFSRDSDSNQSYASGTDQLKSIDKTVRVVSSIDYFLED